MDWYYAVGGQRFGPFDRDVFDQLVEQGRITGVTLVWHDGLEDWVQHQFLGDQTQFDAEDRAPPVVVRCSQCHRQGAGDDMVRYQKHWVCSECKNTFFQRVREGGVSMEEAASGSRLRHAGFWIRVGSGILDILILIVAITAINLVSSPLLNSIRSIDAGALVEWIIILAYLSVFIFYVTWFLGKFGATPGKMACGLQVQVSSGRRITFMRAFARAWAALLGLAISIVAWVTMLWLAGAVIGEALGDSISAIIGIMSLVTIVGGLLSLFPFYMAGMNRRKYALHDFICNTRVIHAN